LVGINNQAEVLVRSINNTANRTQILPARGHDIILWDKRMSVGLGLVEKMKPSAVGRPRASSNWVQT
jgi:hypothetical protein